MNIALPTYAALLKLYELVSEGAVASATREVERLESTIGSATPAEARKIREKIGKARADGLARLWADAIATPAYKWLHNRVEFQRAWQVFQKKKALKKASPLILADDADFKFLFSVVWSFMIFIDQSDPKRRRRLPSKRTAIQVLGHVRKILEAELGYLKIRQPVLDGLRQLERQMVDVGNRRKPTENHTYAHRSFVTCLAGYFGKDFAQAMPVAVAELCALIGYDVTHEALRIQLNGPVQRGRKAYQANVLAGRIGPPIPKGKSKI